MTTMKTLMLAGLAAMSLGAGTAMAQEGGPSMPGPNDYWTHQTLEMYAHQLPASNANPVQAGSSDVNKNANWFNSGWGNNNSPYRFQYGALGGNG
jgi:hypothetical protein